MGFLAEAEQDYDLERWRSCVDNAQLSVENAGKAALAMFGIVPKTHDPSRQINAIAHYPDTPRSVADLLISMLPDLLALGTEAHFLTDYGDEATHTLPWDLFTQETADDALSAAQRTLGVARSLQQIILDS